VCVCVRVCVHACESECVKEKQLAANTKRGTHILCALSLRSKCQRTVHRVMEPAADMGIHVDMSS